MIADKLYIWGEHITEGSSNKELLIVKPISIPFKHKILNISCGFEHTLLLAQDNCVYAFGKNNNG